jgi:hypothetical protein
MEKNQMVNQHITDEELQRKQEQAVELIANGKTDVEVAKLTRVSRQTVNEWKNHDVEFQLDLQVRRREIIFGMRDKMNELWTRSSIPYPLRSAVGYRGALGISALGSCRGLRRTWKARMQRFN